MKFRLVTCAIILSCLFTIMYFYTFTSILQAPVSATMSNKMIYYNQIGCFKNPDTMSNILDRNNIKYTTYVDNEYTYIISGISESKEETKSNQMELSSKSIDSIEKEIVMSNLNNNIETAILEYLNR